MTVTNYSPEVLKSFKPTQEFFIGIDSDGCAFDSMEIKHKECFCPAYVKHFGLQPVAKYARETWEFVNLYSTWRGTNRFLALEKCLELLAVRPEVLARGVERIDDSALREWTRVESKLSSATIKKFALENPDMKPFMKQCHDWSLMVDAMIRDIVEGVPPFPFLRESLEIAKDKADIIVCSATPCEALEREWAEHNIAQYPQIICGSEMGSKKEHLALAAAPNFPADKTLMIGDAPGDMNAAKSINACFFPVLPGSEEASWERFHNEALAKFFAGEYRGEYEDGLLAEFDKCLPEDRPWNEID